MPQFVQDKRPSHAEYLADRIRQAPERGFPRARVVASLKRIMELHWFRRGPADVPDDVPEMVDACAGAIRATFAGNDGAQGARELVAEAVRLGLPAQAARAIGEAHGL